jgi:hypothetical protein
VDCTGAYLPPPLLPSSIQVASIGVHCPSMMFSSLKPVPIKSMGLSRRHECRRGKHRCARGLIPGLTAQGAPPSLRQAARPRSQRRWPLAPGHWAEVGVACGASCGQPGLRLILTSKQVFHNASSRSASIWRPVPGWQCLSLLPSISPCIAMVETGTFGKVINVRPYDEIILQDSVQFDVRKLVGNWSKFWAGGDLDLILI